MLTYVRQEKWFFASVGVALAVAVGSMYVHFVVEDEDKPAWLAAATDAVVDVFGELDDLRTIGGPPECGDSETVRKVEDLARDLVFQAMPYNIEQPFHLDRIELVAVTEREHDDDEARVCRAHLRAPHLGRPGQQYRLGVISYSIHEDETKSDWWVIEAQLESVNLRRWAD